MNNLEHMNIWNDSGKLPKMGGMKVKDLPGFFSSCVDSLVLEWSTLLVLQENGNKEVNTYGMVI